MAAKPTFPFKNEKQDKAEDRRDAMNKGKLPGLEKLPRGAMKKDNPNDSPAKERMERRMGIKT